jgi:hypothetical protein
VKAPFGTRLDQGLQRRLKVYAAATDQTIEDVVTAALSGYLPAAPAAQTATPEQQEAAPAL